MLTIDRRLRIRLWHVLAAFFILAVAYNAVNPEYEAPDEPHHLDYVRYLVQYRSLPPQVPEPTVIPPGGVTESHQPPLYYALVALATSWLDTRDLPGWHRNPYVTWLDHPTTSYLALHREDEGFPYRGVSLALHASRLVSSAMGLVTILCTYLLAKLILKREDIALGASALAAFTPGFLFASASVNNDNGVVMFSSLFLLMSAWLLSKPISVWRLVTYGLVVVGAVLTKTNGLQLLPVTALTMLILAARETMGFGLSGIADENKKASTQVRLGSKAFLLAGGGIVVIALAVIVAAKANLPGLGRVSSGITTAALWLSPGWIIGVIQAGSWDKLGDLGVGLFSSYWGVFGWQNLRMHPQVYVVITIICLTAVAGLGRFIQHAKGWPQLMLSQRASLLIELASIGVVLWVIASRYQLGNYWPGLNHGRFLFPVIPALSLFMALGLAQLKLPRLRFSALPVVVLLLLALSALAPFVYIKPFYNFPAIPVRSTLDSRVAIQRTEAEFENGVSIEGFTLDRPNYGPGDEILITLYWKAKRNVSGNFTSFVHLVDLDGGSRAGADAVPLESLFPPEQWEKGEIIREEKKLSIPVDAPSGLYDIELGLYTPLYNQTQPIPIQALRGASDESKMRVRLGRLKVKGAEELGPVTKRLSYDFNHEIELIGYDLLPSSKESISVVLYWRAKRSISTDYTISVQVLGDENRAIGQHDGQPGAGLNPTSAWARDEIVKDKHNVAVPTTSNSRLRFAVIVYSLGDLRRLPVYSADGKLLSDSVTVEESPGP